MAVQTIMLVATYFGIEEKENMIMKIRNNYQEALKANKSLESELRLVSEQLESFKIIDATTIYKLEAMGIKDYEIIEEALHNAITEKRQDMQREIKNGYRDDFNISQLIRLPLESNPSKEELTKSQQKLKSFA